VTKWGKEINKEKYEESGGCEEGEREKMIMMRRSRRKTARGYRGRGGGDK
jgi:hypothetical protein